MKVSKHNHLFQLTFFPTLFPVNCYIVEEEKELTLVDTGLPNSYKKILAFARGINKPITKIVLTHAHGDHIGSLDALKNALPEAKVYISKRDARIMNGDHSIDTGEVYPLRGGLPKNVMTKPDMLLQDGDEIGSLTSISMPGHTPGSMAFMDRRDRCLIAGDAFQTRGGFAVAGQTKILFPFPSMATWNKEAAMESAKRILGLNISILAVGHGSILKNPQKELEGIIHQEKR